MPFYLRECASIDLKALSARAWRTASNVGNKSCPRKCHLHQHICLLYIHLLLPLTLSKKMPIFIIYCVGGLVMCKIIKK